MDEGSPGSEDLEGCSGGWVAHPQVVSDPLPVFMCLSDLDLKADGDSAIS